MNEPITPYGIVNASELMQAFHRLGNQMLKKLLAKKAAPADKKTLRTYGIREAAQFIGRTEQHIRNLETKEGHFFPPLKDTYGRRYYTLERINQFRDYLGTRFKRNPLSEAIIFAITNFKGGVAKSHTALSFAHKCALEGLRVCVIDLDPQATLTLGFGFIPDIDLGINDTIAAALEEDPFAIKRLIKKTYFDGIWIVPGNLALADVELNLTDYDKQSQLIPRLGKIELRLKKALDVIKNDFDIIILDCGPNLGILTINAVAAATGILVPMPPEMNNFASFTTFTGTLAVLFERLKKNYDFFRIVLTKHSGKNEALSMDDMMREKFGRYMLTNHVVESTEIAKASSNFGSAYELPSSNTRSYKRAISSLDNVFNEALSACKAIWKAQQAIANVKNERHTTV